MHSAIVTVNVGSGSDAVLGFAVSKSSTAPDHGTVKDKPIFYTRKFTSRESRNLYLSVTDKTPATDTGFTTDGMTPAKLTDPTQYLAKNTKYYLYTYDSSGSVVNTYSFTTADYPTAAMVNAATTDGIPYGYEKLPSPTPVVDKKNGEQIMISAAVINLIAGIEVLKDGYTVTEASTDASMVFPARRFSYFVQHNSVMDSGSKVFQDLLFFDRFSSEEFFGSLVYSSGINAALGRIVNFKEATE